MTRKGIKFCYGSEFGIGSELDKISTSEKFSEEIREVYHQVKRDKLNEVLTNPSRFLQEVSSDGETEE